MEVAAPVSGFQGPVADSTVMNIDTPLKGEEAVQKVSAANSVKPSADFSRLFLN